MEKYCKSCGAVFNDLKFKLCPYCGGELDTRYGRQPIPRKLRHEVFKRDGYKCKECGASKDETSLEIDHIVPVARGGTNDIDNLQTLCRECNRMKHTDEWVGGETDLESLEKKLLSLKEQLDEAEEKLTQAYGEEKIECTFQIKVLNEEIEQLKEEIINKTEEIEEQERIEAERQEEEKRKDLLYKELYVELSDDDFTIIYQILREKNLFYALYNKKLPNELSNGSLIDDKHEFLKKLVNELSEKEIWDLLKWEEQLELKINSFLDEFKEEDILLFKLSNKDTPRNIIIRFLKGNDNNSKKDFELKIKEEKERIETIKRIEKIQYDEKIKKQRLKEERKRRDEEKNKEIKKFLDDFSSDEILLLKNRLNMKMRNDPEHVLQYFIRRYGVEITRKMILDEMKKANKNANS